MPECVDVVEAAYRDAVDVGVTENRSPASIIGRKAPRVAALADDLASKFQGRVQGGVGDIAERAGMLENALHEVSRAEVDQLATRVNRRIYGRLGRSGELENLTYVGPEEFADAANGPYKDLVFASSPPEYWKGATPETYKEINALRRIAEERKATAEALGYPSQASRDNYLRQEWEQVDEAVRLFSDPAQGGLISPAKQRAIPVHAVGINAGLTPTSKTIGELLTDSIALWDRAIAEAFERKIVLARYGTKGGAGAITKGQAPFRHALYRGWSADRDIVNAVEGLHKPPGKITRVALDEAAAFKNTVFGPADTGVFGVQGIKGLGLGGVPLFANQIVRGLALLRLGPARHFRELMQSGKLPLLTKMANGGLHLGLGPSAVTPGKGTILKYIPVVGKAIDRPVSAFIDAKARVEFGMILNWLRVQIAEGNLLILHMAGRDINDPKVWKTAMDWANAPTGASRGAQTPGRRALETASLTSFQMTRSEIATLGAVTKAAVAGTPEERLLAAAQLMSLGGMVYGLGSAVNMAFGNGPVEFNPLKPDWATIKVGGQNVPIIPSRGLVRAIGKSIVELSEMEDADLEKVTQIWAQYALSKQGPGITGPTANLTGFGFDPDVGFRTGDLPAKYRFLNALPMPPLVSSLVIEEDSRNATSAGFQFAGFNPFPTSQFGLMQEAQEAEFQRLAVAGALPDISVDGVRRQPNDYAELKLHNSAAANIIDQAPSVVEAQERLSTEGRGRLTEEGRGFTTAEEFRTEAITAQEQDDERLATFFRTGRGLEPGNWQEEQANRQRSLFAAREGIFAQAGIEFEDREAPAGSVNEAIQNYFSVDIEGFMNNLTREVDWAGFANAKERALRRLSPRDRRDVDDFIHQYETDTERAFRKLQAELGPYFDIDSDAPRASQQREFLRQSTPRLDAILWMTGITGVESVLTGSAQTQAARLLRSELGVQIRREDIPRRSATRGGGAGGVGTAGGVGGVGTAR